MDVEKTIQAILESQLRAEKRADRADERMDRAEKRADSAEKRADRFDKQINATKNLVQKGMQIVLKMNAERKESSAEFRFRINALIDSQNRTEAALRKTDEKFNRWLETLSRKGTNGHKK
jgi:hypothetical protein